MNDLIIHGLLLQIGSKYVCWNSYKAQYFLGTRHLSEIFSLVVKWRNELVRKTQLEKAKELYPTARIVEIRKDE